MTSFAVITTDRPAHEVDLERLDQLTSADLLALIRTLQDEHLRRAVGSVDQPEITRLVFSDFLKRRAGSIAGGSIGSTVCNLLARYARAELPEAGPLTANFEAPGAPSNAFAVLGLDPLSDSVPLDAGGDLERAAVNVIIPPPYQQLGTAMISDGPILAKRRLGAVLATRAAGPFADSTVRNDVSVANALLSSVQYVAAEVLPNHPLLVGWDRAMRPLSMPKRSRKIERTPGRSDLDTMIATLSAYDDEINERLKVIVGSTEFAVAPNELRELLWNAPRWRLTQTGLYELTTKRGTILLAIAVACRRRALAALKVKNLHPDLLRIRPGFFTEGAPAPDGHRELAALEITPGKGAAEELKPITRPFFIRLQTMLSARDAFYQRRSDPEDALLSSRWTIRGAIAAGRPLPHRSLKGLSNSFTGAAPNANGKAMVSLLPFDIRAAGKTWNQLVELGIAADNPSAWQGPGAHGPRRGTCALLSDFGDRWLQAHPELPGRATGRAAREALASHNTLTDDDYNYTGLHEKRAREWLSLLAICCITDVIDGDFALPRGPDVNALRNSYIEEAELEARVASERARVRDDLIPAKRRGEPGADADIEEAKLGIDELETRLDERRARTRQLDKDKRTWITFERGVRPCDPAQIRAEVFGVACDGSYAVGIVRDWLTEEELARVSNVSQSSIYRQRLGKTGRRPLWNGRCPVAEPDKRTRLYWVPALNADCFRSVEKRLQLNEMLASYPRTAEGDFVAGWAAGGAKRRRLPLHLPPGVKRTNELAVLPPGVEPALLPVTDADASNS